MKTTRVALISVTCLCALAAHAKPVSDEAMPAAQQEQWQSAYYSNERLLHGTEFEWSDASEKSLLPYSGLIWRLDPVIFDGVYNVVGFWPSIHWLNPTNIGDSMASLGYTWRNLKLEGALFKRRETDPNRAPMMKITSSGRRLTYKMGSNWSLQLSRGFHHSPDQLRPDIKIRRTTASATHRSSLYGQPWNTTMAWGRGRGVSGTNGTAFLLESAVRVDDDHTFFTKFERAGNDELFPNELASRQQRYEVSKFSLGYLYDVVSARHAKLGIGGLASRRIVPHELESYYGNKDTSYMVFLRLQLQFAAN